MQSTWVWSWSRKIPHTSGQLSPCATTTEPGCPRASVPQLKSSPSLPQLGKAHAQQWNQNPAQPKIKIKLKENSFKVYPQIKDEYPQRNKELVKTEGKKRPKTQQKRGQNTQILHQELYYPEIDGETVETVSNFIFLGSKVTADGDCSHEIKRHSLLGRKVMTNLNSILKSRDITLLTKVRLVKAMVFSSSHVWMWELDCEESWAPKTDAFELGYWRRLLRVPWTARRSNQSFWRRSALGFLWKEWC